MAVQIRPDGLWLADRQMLIPLWSGAMHYWRHAPEDWGPCLDAMKAMGLRLVDTYVPWGIHEVAPGTFDFGERYARLDVARFIRLAEEKGLYVIVRPGPHINAELTYFGLPERVVWERDCQARSPRGNAVVLPMVPLSFPVPSYASEVFHEETSLWFEAAGRVIAPLVYPHGPVVLLQIDNEGALYFRDGPYDQDYHPDAIRLFRDFLREKYTNVSALREAWLDATLTFSAAAPPVRFDATEAEHLAHHLDWMEFHEHLLAVAMGRFSEALGRAGLGSLPTFHNFPLGEAVSALNAGRVGEMVDLVALDYYHAANPQNHMAILRRTGELAARSEGTQTVAFGAEVGAGFAPFFPPLDESDSMYTLMAALAYGLRGFNLYMAVDRDRWVGAPIDVRGIPRPFADDYRALIAALERVEFHRLRRDAPVRLVVPRALRRLARATHAFGPITPLAFHIAAAGPLESCFEDDVGLGENAPIAGEAFLRAFERALLARGVPFAYAGGESLEPAIAGASWVVCATAGGVKREVLAMLREAQMQGTRVTIGPRVPERDGSMRRVDPPHDTFELEVEPLDDPARADVLVAKYIDMLELPAYPVDAPDVHVTIHRDESGAARVVFVMNPTRNDVTATIGLGRCRVRQLVDLLPRSRVSATLQPDEGTGAWVVSVAARSVRMFAVET